MKTLLLATFLFVIGSGVALAEEHTNDVFLPHAEQHDLWASELIGANVHMTEAEVDDTTAIDTAPEGWEVVADIREIVMNRDGTVRGALLDVGGFLGIGARTVMVSMDALRFVDRADTNEVFVVFTATREQLEAAPEFDDTLRAERDDTVATAPAERDRVGVGQPADRFERVELTALTADHLMGANVFDQFNENVADVGDIVFSEDGTEVQALLVDIGGFLGIGARTVAVDIDQLEIFHDPQTNDVAVYINMTEQELEALPEYRR